ncbi:hypothetical protein KIPB_001804, partial [Kipferlia bialata]
AVLPKLRVDMPKSLGLPLTCVGEVSSTPLTLTNTGDVPAVYEWRAKAPFSLEPRTGVIGVGQSAPVTLSFHPESGGTVEGSVVCVLSPSGMDKGVSGSYQVVSVCGTAKYAYLKCEVERETTLDAEEDKEDLMSGRERGLAAKEEEGERSLSFGDVAVGTSERRTFSLTNLSEVPVTVSSRLLSEEEGSRRVGPGNAFSVSPKDGVVAPFKSVTFTVRHKCNTPGAQNTDTAVVTTKGGIETRVSLSAHTIGPTVSLSENAMYFGGVVPGESRSHFVSLNSTFSRPVAFSLSLPEAKERDTGPGVSAPLCVSPCSGVLQPNTPIRIKVTLCPPASCPPMPVGYVGAVSVAGTAPVPFICAGSVVPSDQDSVARPAFVTPAMVLRYMGVRESLSFDDVQSWVGKEAGDDDTDMSESPLYDAGYPEYAGPTPSLSYMPLHPSLGMAAALGFSEGPNAMSASPLVLSTRTVVFPRSTGLRVEKEVLVSNTSSYPLRCIVSSGGMGTGHKGDFSLSTEAFLVPPNSGFPLQVRYTPKRLRTVSSCTLTVMAFTPDCLRWQLFKRQAIPAPLCASISLVGSSVPTTSTPPPVSLSLHPTHSPLPIANAEVDQYLCLPPSAPGCATSVSVSVHNPAQDPMVVLLEGMSLGTSGDTSTQWTPGTGASGLLLADTDVIALPPGASSVITLAGVPPQHSLLGRGRSKSAESTIPLRMRLNASSNSVVSCKVILSGSTPDIRVRTGLETTPLVTGKGGPRIHRPIVALPTVSVGSRVSAVLSLVSRASTPTDISIRAPLCSGLDCLSISPEALTLGPRETAQVQVTLRGDTSLPLGPFDESLSLSVTPAGMAPSPLSILRALGSGGTALPASAFPAPLSGVVETEEEERERESAMVRLVGEVVRRDVTAEPARLSLDAVKEREEVSFIVTLHNNVASAVPFAVQMDEGEREDMEGTSKGVASLNKGVVPFGSVEQGTGHVMVEPCSGVIPADGRVRLFVKYSPQRLGLIRASLNVHLSASALSGVCTGGEDEGERERDDECGAVVRVPVTLEARLPSLLISTVASNCTSTQLYDYIDVNALNRHLQGERDIHEITLTEGTLQEQQLALEHIETFPVLFRPSVPASTPLPLGAPCADPDAHSTDRVTLGLENPGPLTVTLRLSVPGVQQDMPTAPWAKQPPTKEEATIRMYVDNGVFSTSSVTVTLAPQEKGRISLFHRHIYSGVHELRLLCQVDDGRAFLLLLLGQTLTTARVPTPSSLRRPTRSRERLSATGASRRGMYTRDAEREAEAEGTASPVVLTPLSLPLVPVALGEACPPVQLLTLSNPAAEPVVYYIPQTALDKINSLLGRADCPVLHVLNPLGIIPGHSSTDVRILHRPLQACKFRVPLPIHVMSQASASGASQDDVAPVEVTETQLEGVYDLLNSRFGGDREKESVTGPDTVTFRPTGMNSPSRVTRALQRSRARSQLRDREADREEGALVLGDDMESSRGSSPALGSRGGDMGTRDNAPTPFATVEIIGLSYDPRELLIEPSQRSLSALSLPPHLSRCEVDRPLSGALTVGGALGCEGVGLATLSAGKVSFCGVPCNSVSSTVLTVENTHCEPISFNIIEPQSLKGFGHLSASPSSGTLAVGGTINVKVELHVYDVPVAILDDIGVHVEALGTGARVSDDSSWQTSLANTSRTIEHSMNGAISRMSDVGGGMRPESSTRGGKGAPSKLACTIEERLTGFKPVANEDTLYAILCVHSHLSNALPLYEGAPSGLCASNNAICVPTVVPGGKPASYTPDALLVGSVVNELVSEAPVQQYVASAVAHGPAPAAYQVFGSQATAETSEDYEGVDGDFEERQGEREVARENVDIDSLEYAANIGGEAALSFDMVADAVDYEVMYALESVFRGVVSDVVSGAEEGKREDTAEYDRYEETAPLEYEGEGEGEREDDYYADELAQKSMAR